MNDLKTLALAANAAHPDIPWHNSDDLIAIGIDDDCDADFVANASPDAILALLAERDRLREALTDTRKRLQEANECGVITDTLWYSEYETLFDYIDFSLAGASHE